MEDTSNATEHVNPLVILEVKSERDTVERDLTDLAKFAHDELQLYKSNGDFLSDSSKQHWGSVIIHIKARKEAERRLKGKLPTKFVFARDGNGLLLGYSIVSFSSNPEKTLPKAELSFLGVRSKNHHSGIGTKILLETNRVLKVLEIKEYVTDARYNTVGLFDSLGIHYREVPNPDISESGKHLLVSL